MDQLKDRDRPVIIAGGGIGGLAAALALASRGYPSRVLEQAPEFREVGAGIQLGPNSWRCLRAMGAEPAAKKLAVFPEAQHQGIGTLLLRSAREASPDELRLFTFQRNAAARAFYAKLGFSPVAFGISPAPECEPDVELRWVARHHARSDARDGRCGPSVD